MKNTLIILLSALLLGACSHPAKQTFKVGGISFTMLRVDAGTFNMGATPDQGEFFRPDELPVHKAQLSTFYIGETEVTQALWEAVMGSTIEDLSAQAVEYFEGRISGDDTDHETIYARSAASLCARLYGQGPDYPVYYVSWEQANEFCRRLSEMTGREFCLPTEAQWAYAARGGKLGKNYMYSGSNNMHEVGWTDEALDEGGTHPVAQLLPNEIGAYDMTGNVWEHCADYYGPYLLEKQFDPQGPDSGDFRVLRGAGWRSDKLLARTSAREKQLPDYRYYNLGFRLAMKAK